jgi:hypothetical protein
MWVLAPAIWERQLKVVHLADAFVLMISLLGAGLPGWWTVPLALIAGATRETAPLFIALWGGNPLALLGLLAVPVWRKGGSHFRHDHLFVTPWKTFSRIRLRTGFTLDYVFPFGGAIAGIANPYSWIVLGIAAIPLFRSIDTSRLLMWAMPWMLVAAVSGAPDGALLAMIAWSTITSSHWLP